MFLLKRCRLVEKLMRHSVDSLKISSRLKRHKVKEEVYLSFFFCTNRDLSLVKTLDLIQTTADSLIKIAMDPVYEFDAPRFVDFLRLAEGDEDSDTDAWFDHSK